MKKGIVMTLLIAAVFVNAVLCGESVSDGLEAYRSGAKGDTEAAEKAMKIFEELFEQSGDPWHEALLGSACVLMARDAALTKKIAFVRQGLAHLDHAAGAGNVTLWVFWERGMSSLNLPSFLGRAQRAEDDLLACVQAASSPGKRDLEIASAYNGQTEGLGSAQDMFRYYYAKALAANGKTKKAQSQLRKIGKDSAYGPAAESEMKKLSAK